MWAKFLTLEADGTQKFTEEYSSEPDRQVWNLTKAEEQVPSAEELGAKILKRLSFESAFWGLRKPFMLQNMASKRFLLHERPPLDEDAAKTDPLNTNMAELPGKENMPEAFKNDTDEANILTIVQKKLWRRAFWQGVKKADSTYLQGEMTLATLSGLCDRCCGL